jgi:chromosome partitioning protein
MQTIVLATQKGGSGKSTLAIGLAVAAMQAGHVVRLMETDPQGTLSNWRRRRPHSEPTIECVYNAIEIEQRLAGLDRSGVKLTIIDTPGGVSAAATAAIRHANLCLIPTRPSVADIEATASTLQVIRAWKKPFAFVLNQTPTRGQRLNDAANALGNEAALDVAHVLAEPFIAMRNDHQDALSAGLAVSEYDPDGKSTEEVRSLWKWIEAKLDAAELQVSPIERPRPRINRLPPPPEFVAAMFLREPAKTAPPIPHGIELMRTN